MVAPRCDRPFIRWARRNRLRYYYTYGQGLPDQSLKLHIGVVTAYINRGKLIRLAVDSQGDLLDEMMCEFSQLFALCARHRAYLRQAPCTIRPARHLASETG